MGNQEFINSHEYKLLKSRAERYCDVQDRSISETVMKLKLWGCEPEWQHTIINELSSSGHIDEQRFANNFARGKFRIKSWGKLKITAALYQLKIPSAIINNALNQIDEADYRNTLTEIIEKKLKITRGEANIRINKTAAYALGKGFESTLVFEVLKTINLK
jgi:regulatory protein